MSLLQRFRSLFFATSTLSSSKSTVIPPKRRKLALESLEERSLLSANISDNWSVNVSADFSVNPVDTVLYECPVYEQPMGPAVFDPQLLSPPALSGEMEDTFRLHSNPGAKHIIYLDFDGHTTTGTSWNSGTTFVTPAFDFDNNPSVFSSGELLAIQRAWRIVAEDFLPFDVDVTTEEPDLDRLIKTNGDDQYWGIRVVIGGSCYDWYKSGAGGIAYVGSFNWDTDTPCFVFKEAIFSRDFQEAISHEVGHTLGLGHDGKETTEYYGGHNGWAPIMGSSYNITLTQWSKGEYPGATLLEDDLFIITTQNGFSYRQDDHGDTLATATVLSGTNSGVDSAVYSYSATGIIERNTDVDVFSFITTGEVDFTIYGVTERSNLDIKAELWDSTGTVVMVSAPTDSLNVSLRTTVEAGIYYIRISGDGKGDPLTNGYSNYGSLGAYTIQSTIQWEWGQLQPPVLTTVSANDDSEIAVEWNPVEWATGYTLQYSTDSDFLSSTITPVTIHFSADDTTAIITDLIADTTYYIRICAVGDGTTCMSSDFTEPFSVTTKSPPPPLDQDVTVTTTSVIIRNTSSIKTGTYTESVASRLKSLNEWSHFTMDIWAMVSDNGTILSFTGGEIRFSNTLFRLKSVEFGAGMDGTYDVTHDGGTGVVSFSSESAENSVEHPAANLAEIFADNSAANTSEQRAAVPSQDGEESSSGQRAMLLARLHFIPVETSSYMWDTIQPVSSGVVADVTAIEIIARNESYRQFEHSVPFAVDDLMVSPVSPYDLTGSGSVSLADFALFIKQFGKSGTTQPDVVSADFNGDGDVNLTDFSLFIKAFGKTRYPFTV